MKFFKRSKTAGIVDRVYISKQAKFRAMAALLKNDPVAIFCFWFDESQREAEAFFQQQELKPVCFQARELSSHHLSGNTLFFAEHYPLKTSEERLFEKLKLSPAIVYSSLDEPLFKYFGGDNIIKLVQKMGMDETECIEHAFISKSIRNAQEKIENKIFMDQPAHSAHDWFEKNIS